MSRGCCLNIFNPTPSYFVIKKFQVTQISTLMVECYGCFLVIPGQMENEALSQIVVGLRQVLENEENGSDPLTGV
jgi:hypothetical protein